MPQVTGDQAETERLGDLETSDFRIVISSVSEKSSLQTGKLRLCERKNTQQQGIASLPVLM